jgi:2-dehydropantoate 2-reductase
MATAMRVLVLGAGGTGGVFGARLLQAGAEVTFLARARRAEELRAHGLAVAFPEGIFRRHAGVRLATELEPGYDAIVLSCKAYDLDAAVDAIRPAVGTDAVVVPLLNGVAHFDTLDRAFGGGRVAGGTCHLSCVLEPDGTVRQISPYARLALGPRPGMAATGRSTLQRLAEMLGVTPVDCRCSNDVMQDVWEKFAFIATLASATCLFRAAICDIVRAPAGERLVTDLFETCTAIAALAGFPLRETSFRGFRGALTDPASTLTSSTLRDLESGKRTEADHIVGDMQRRAQSAGRRCALLEAAYVHLLAREARLARERTA